MTAKLSAEIRVYKHEFLNNEYANVLIVSKMEDPKGVDYVTG